MRILPLQKVYTGMTEHYFVKSMKEVLELKMALEEKMNHLTAEEEQDYKNKIMALELLKCTDEKEMLAYMEEKMSEYNKHQYFVIIGNKGT